MGGFVLAVFMAIGFVTTGGFFGGTSKIINWVYIIDISENIRVKVYTWNGKFLVIKYLKKLISKSYQIARSNYF